MSVLVARSLPRFRIGPAAVLGLLLWALLPRAAADDPRQGTLPQHPLELRALVEPEAVLAELPAAIAQAEQADDQTQVALLALAEANACRVIADWLCQRRAALRAEQAGRRGGSAILQLRGLILQSRAVMALKDFSEAERLLQIAQSTLDANAPSPEIEADIQLAYSSLSESLGKHALAVDYAERGLQRLGNDIALPLRARLLRNLARAQARLGEVEAARAALARGIEAASAVDDPKLSAELHLESARLARRERDPVAHQQHIDAVLQMAERLKNSQLFGLGHEALGLQALAEADPARARQHLQQAVTSFRSLGLDRDELRASRQLIVQLLDAPDDRDHLNTTLRRFLQLDVAVEKRERDKAADDFEARLSFAQQQLEFERLQNEARMAEARAASLAEQQRLSGWIIALGLLSLLVLSSFFLQQRRAHRRLAAVLVELRESEARAVDLSRLSRGAVFLHDLQGRLRLLNPAARALWAVPSEQPPGALQDFIDAASQAALQTYLQALRDCGEAEAELSFDVAGQHRLLRLSGKVSAEQSARPYAVGHAVDITEDARRAAELRGQALHDPLTGSYNRRYLEEFAHRDPAPTLWSVLNIDLDHFKRINDRDGHERGDQVLREIAQFFLARLRAHDALVRVGGDEFLILLDDADPAHLAGLRARLERDRDLAPCGYSLGSALREGGESLEATMARADADMYQGRRRVRGSD